jgi:hypothetical protein
MVASFISGGHQSIRRKPPTCRKSLTTLSHNVVLSTPHLIRTHNVSGDRFRFMVFNATFNNISVISWWQVLLVKETGIPGENHRPVASH